jgi:hypothetical protein
MSQEDGLNQETVGSIQVPGRVFFVSFESGTDFQTRARTSLSPVAGKIDPPAG